MARASREDREPSPDRAFPPQKRREVEDWLKLIRLRVGDDARVGVVSTHCRTGERIARIDKPVLLRDFGPLIVGFHEVDSLVDDPETGQKVGVAELKDLIAATAKDLEQMGWSSTATGEKRATSSWPCRCRG